jgi:predicted CXXCH cytochrome family protein
MKRFRILVNVGHWTGASLALLGVSLLGFHGCTPGAPSGNDNVVDNGNDNTSPAERAFAGAAACQACHSDAHADWEQTPHAEAFETLRRINQHENAVCVQCHTVGFGATDGFVNEATTPHLIGVQCENCHGPAGAHARNPGDAALRPRIDAALMSSQVCGSCHTGAHHPTFDEWQLSRHGSALEGLRANSFSRDSCLECHSQDYRWAVENELAELPTIDNAVLSIECATCHAPHGNAALPSQLRMPIANLCGQCHTQEEAALGDTPHHPQFEMLTGTGAFSENGLPLILSHAHTSLTSGGGQACAQCHVVRFEVESPNMGNPNVTGHTFNPFDESITSNQAAPYTGCLLCHTADAAASLRGETQSSITARLAALAPRFTAGSDSYIDPATLSEQDRALLQAARFNYLFVGADGSDGVHNPAYADALLSAAERIVLRLTQ